LDDAHPVEPEPGDVTAVGDNANHDSLLPVSCLQCYRKQLYSF
jgi:hypothetical protein